MAETAAEAEALATTRPEQGRPSSGRAERMSRVQNGTGGPEIGSGRVLGSSMTDSLGVEMGYGVDGKTEVTLLGRTLIFAPVSLDDMDDAGADLQRVSTALMAVGMVRPGSPIEDITPQDVAIMLRIITGSDDVSEYQAAVTVGMLFYNLTSEQRQAIARLIWYSLRRWQDDVELTFVTRALDMANIPFLFRLWFRKNLGVLDRFLQHAMGLTPPAPETVEKDFQPTTPTVDPALFARLMSEEAVAGAISEPTQEAE